MPVAASPTHTRPVILIAVTLTVVGLVAGIVTALVVPRPYTSADDVMLAPAPGFPAGMGYVRTEAGLATIEPVLAEASRTLGVRAGPASLRPIVRATPITDRVLQVTAQGASAQAAERTDMAAIRAFLRYTASGASVRQVHSAVLFNVPKLLPRTSLLARTARYGGDGLLYGLGLAILFLLAAEWGGRPRALTVLRHHWRIGRRATQDQR